MRKVPGFRVSGGTANAAETAGIEAVVTGEATMPKEKRARARCVVLRVESRAMLMAEEAGRGSGRGLCVRDNFQLTSVDTNVGSVNWWEKLKFSANLPVTKSW